MADVLVFGILLLAPVALWGALCALTAMHPSETRPAIAVSFLLIAWGWGAITFAAVDYLINASPLFWPKVLLFGVIALAGGNASLYMANRRDCRCAGCPGMRSVRRIHHTTPGQSAQKEMRC